MISSLKKKSGVLGARSISSRTESRRPPAAAPWMRSSPRSVRTEIRKVVVR